MPPYLAFQLYSVASETPCLRAKIGGLAASLVLLQHPNDLLFRKPCSLHLSVLRRVGL